MQSHVAVSRKRGMSDIGLILHDERHIALEEYAPHHSARNLDSNPSEAHSVEIGQMAYNLGWPRFKYGVANFAL